MNRRYWFGGRGAKFYSITNPKVTGCFGSVAMLRLPVLHFSEKDEVRVPLFVQQGDRIFLLKRKQEAEHWCCTSVGRIRLASPTRRVLATNTGEFRREKAIILRRAQCSRSIAYCSYLFASPKRKKARITSTKYYALQGTPRCAGGEGPRKVG